MAQKLSIHIIETACIGCGRCVNRCHNKVLSMQYGNRRSYAWVENPDNCSGCRRCEKNCPAGVIIITNK